MPVFTTVGGIGPLGLDGEFTAEIVLGNLDVPFSIPDIATGHREVAPFDEGDAHRFVFAWVVAEGIRLVLGLRRHLFLYEGEFPFIEGDGGFRGQAQRDFEIVECVLVALLRGDDRLSGGEEVRTGLVNLDAVHAAGFEHHLGSLPVEVEALCIVI